jgi:ring-1,2-phenylacetyl-CoA epoxidase subunit PaaE
MLTFHSLRVVDIHPEAEDAVGISLEVPPELRDEYRGLPGQHIVVKTDINDEENRRTYSLVNAPGEWPLRIVARVHSAGQMSRYLAEQLNAGDHLEVLPPNGSFTPRRAQAGGTYVAFASGCGITPVLAVARSLLAAHPDNRVMVVYGNASTGRTMCLEELLALKDRYLQRLSLHFVMSREPQEVDLYNGRIDASRVRQFAQVLFAPNEVSEYFVCGPGNMIDEVSTTLHELGVEVDRIHGEHFTVATVSSTAAGSPVAAGATPSARQTPPNGPGRSEAAAPPETTAPAVAADQCEVTVLMDGRRRTFTMRMNDEVVLDAAARAGLELPFSCRAGVCSTCRTKVVKGEVEMAQNYALEEWEVEQGYVLACQSHVKTPVLELDYDEK